MLCQCTLFRFMLLNSSLLDSAAYNVSKVRVQVMPKDGPGGRDW